MKNPLILSSLFPSCSLVRSGLGRAVLAGLAWPMLLAGTAGAITPNQLDNFENGTTMGWSKGVVADPVNIATGGPLGAGDNYLRLTSDGSGSGGKLTLYNRAQWLGNYNLAGVTAIEMDLINMGATPLTIRIGFKQNTSSSSSGYSSTVGFALPADGVWRHAVFGLGSSSMSLVGASIAGGLAGLLNGPGEMRILHSLTPSVHGDNVVGTFGMDNIHAVLVPEPGVWALGAAGAAALLAGAARRRARPSAAQP